MDSNGRTEDDDEAIQQMTTKARRKVKIYSKVTLQGAGGIKHETRCLMDTGNTVTENAAISEELHRELGVGYRHKVRSRVGTASKTGTLTRLGTSNPIRIRIAGLKRRLLVNPTVIPGLTDPLNLGSGFFAALGMSTPTVLEFHKGENKLKIGDDETELIQRLSARSRRMEQGRTNSEKKREKSVPQRLRSIRVKEDQKVKAKSVRFVKVAYDGDHKHETVYVHPKQHGDVETVGALYKWKKTGKIAVLNTSDHDVIVEQGSRIARYETWTEPVVEEESLRRVGEALEVTPEELVKHKDGIIKELGIEENPMLKEHP